MTGLEKILILLLAGAIYIFVKAWKLVKQQDLKITVQTTIISKQSNKLREKGIKITQLEKDLKFYHKSNQR